MGEPRAYYNDNDPFAVAWLRQLITAGLIAPGEVDDRDVRNVRAEDLTGFTQCHFFAGIGGWSLALRLAGWPDDQPVWTGSCPCQPFSSAGRQAGRSDPRDLWPAWFRILRQYRPAVVFGEQVENAIGHGWLDRLCDDLEGEGYAVGAVVLPGACVGAYDSRHRLWFVADRTGDRRREERAVDQGRAEGDGAQGWPAGSGTGRDPSGLADADGGHAGHRAVQRSGEYGLRAEDRRPAGGARDGERPEAGGLADAQRAERGPDEHAGDDGHHRPDAGWPEAHGEPRARGAVRGDVDATQPDRSAPAAGAPERRSFWADAEWLPCRDGKIRPVEPGTFPLAYGVPPRVGYLCATCLQAAAEIEDDEDLQDLRKIALADAQRVPEEVLQPRLHGDRVHEEADDQSGRALAGAAPLPEHDVRAVRGAAAGTAPPSSRSGSDQQRRRQHSGVVSCLSSCGPSGTCERCGQFAEVFRVLFGGQRVGRLRGYGNAVKPPLAAAFIEAYLFASTSRSR